MAQAYDFALDKMGLDISSFPIWSEYIKFLKGVEAVGSYAENQKITAIRKIYQRGIVNPMINIEQLWYVSRSSGNIITIPQLFRSPPQYDKAFSFTDTSCGVLFSCQTVSHRAFPQKLVSFFNFQIQFQITFLRTIICGICSCATSLFF